MYNSFKYARRKVEKILLVRSEANFSTRLQKFLYVILLKENQQNRDC